MCIPIAPNDSHKTRQPVHLAHPLPWLDCYFQTTSNCPVYCRITTTKRDYTPVLPADSPELLKCYTYLDQDDDYRTSMKFKLADGSVTALASAPLPASQPSALGTAETHAPRPVSPTSSTHTSLLPSPWRPFSRCDISDSSSDTHSQYDSPSEVRDSDSVSIIRSDDDETSVTEDVGGLSQGMKLIFEDLINDVGLIDDPVVNIWYDLDMVLEVNDPEYLFEEMNEINKYVASNVLLEWCFEDF